MEAQRVWHLFFMLTGIFVFCLPSMCSGMNRPKLFLKTGRVSVAFSSEKITMKLVLMKPANQSKDWLECFDSSEKQIHMHEINETGGLAQYFDLELPLERLTTSGEYHCQYKNEKVYWFLRVRDTGYKAGIMHEFIILSAFTGVLLVFSVVGSVYVFRGQWGDYKLLYKSSQVETDLLQKEQITECGETGRQRKRNKEERKATEVEEDNADVIATPSTSFYASLEPRPRSIYEVLDRSAANREQDQMEAEPKKNEPQKTMEQIKENQDEGVFESVYENF